MAQLVVTVGIQGSGKTTWSVRTLSATHVRLSRDQLGTAHRLDVLFHAALSVGANVVLDNTHPTAAARARYVRMANAAGYEVVCAWFPPDLDQALARNASRVGKARVPDVAVRGTFAKLEPPTLAEGFDRIDTVETPDA